MDLSTSILGYPLLAWIVLAVIAAICGAIGQSFAGYSPGGCLISLIVGFIGAWLGAWRAQQRGLSLLYVITLGGITFPIVWAIIGSILFAIVLGLVTQRLIVDM